MLLFVSDVSIILGILLFFTDVFFKGKMFVKEM